MLTFINSVSNLCKVCNADGDRLLATPVHVVPRSQAWFWTPGWQGAEQEADDDIAAGRVERHESDEAFLTALDRIWEMTWAADGRATFEYGPEERAGEPPVVWRRIGTHGIVDRP